MSERKPASHLPRRIAGAAAIVGGTAVFAIGMARHAAPAETDRTTASIGHNIEMIAADPNNEKIGGILLAGTGVVTLLLPGMDARRRREDELEPPVDSVDIGS